MSAASGSSPWLLTTTGAAPWTARVFCFAHAGGSPQTFLAWQPALADDAELIAVCAPGSGPRAGESRPGFDELVSGAAAAIADACADDDRPAYLFGHSLGALVAFEVARRLRELPAVRHLVASGISAPDVLPSPRVKQIAALDGREFAEALAFFGGLPPEVLAEDDLLDLLLPGLIAEFRLAASYVYRPAEPLEIGVTLVNGRDDPHVGREQIAHWDRETHTPPALHWADGGHFYFQDDPAAVTEVLRAVVRADQHVEVI